MPDIFVADSKKRQNLPPSSDKPKNVSENKTSVSDTNDYFEKRKHVHLFSSFSRNPDGITFQNQEPDEKVLLFLRKDLITNVPWVVFAFFLIALPFFVPFVIFFMKIPLSFLPPNYILAFAFFYYLLVASYVYVSFITWYYNISLVTNMRVVDVDFAGLVYKNVASTKLVLVQDVSFTQVGVMRTVFDYGDVLVQTAGTLDNFIFEAVPQPENVIHVLGEIIGYDNR